MRQARQPTKRTFDWHHNRRGRRRNDRAKIINDQHPTQCYVIFFDEGWRPHRSAGQVSASSGASGVRAGEVEGKLTRVEAYCGFDARVNSRHHSACV
ncbi:hypothetical protein evm_001307 [Chilo suppressalis]|nr:hypothetical protein evm_001307 [Chilo suppressalis]